MKKIVSLLLVLVVVLGCVGLAACGGDGGGTTTDDGGATTTDGGGTTDDGGTTEDDGGNGGGEGLDDIVANYTGFDAISYTMETTSSGTTMETQVWMEGNKVRTEMEVEGQHVIYIANYDTGDAYMYMPDMNMAYKMDISQMSEPEYEDVQDIAGYNYTIVGTETMDGKVCLVVEYSAEGATVKSWIWKEHGFPIRTEVTTSAGTMVTVFKDISFGDIDDSLFEVDPGVTIMEM